MGAVYRARHVTLDAVFAIKVMHEDIAADSTFAERFHREARAASRLDHPNVIRVVDFGMEPDGILYIVMEYVEGYDLFQVLRRDAPLSETRIVDLLAQALSGIAAAHDTGVVHRDLKPENIMVTTRVGDDGVPREVVKVCDFGIAQISEPPHSVKSERSQQRALTSRGVLLGTPQYMSPEQARGEVTDARTDIYSLGVILYQLLTGQLPFEGPTPIDIVLKHIAEKPVPPSVLAPAAAPRLEAICLKAMTKNRDGRFTTARQMRAALLAEPLSTPPGMRGSTSSDGFASPTPMPLPTMKSDDLGNTLPEGLHDSIPAFRARPSRRVIYTSILVGFALLGATVFVAGRKADEPPPAPSANAPRKPTATTATAQGRPTEMTTSEVAQNAAAATGSASPVTTAKGNARHPVGHAAAAPAGGPAPSRPPTASAPETPSAVEPPPAAPPTPVALAEEPKAPPHDVATASPSPAQAPHDTPPPPAPFVVRPGALRVKWHVAQVGGGTTSGDVTRAVSRAAAAWDACYAAALRARGRRVEGQGTLRLSCDDQGRVVGATFTGGGMPDLAACIQTSVTGITIANADTGEAWATVAVILAVAE
jgi:serine/threonine-protein kinase